MNPCGHFVDRNSNVSLVPSVNMPSAAALAVQNFVDTYSNFQSNTSYLQQWSSQCQALAIQLQADPNYATALSSVEQANVTSIQQVASTALQNLPLPVSVAPVSPVQAPPVTQQIAK